MVIEYLAVIEEQASHALFKMCDSPRVFSELIQKSEKNINIADGVLTLDGRDRFDFTVVMGEVEGKSQRYFHITISAHQEGEEGVTRLVACNRAIRKAMSKNEIQPDTLWSDVSLHYAHKAYPLVHRIENLMRKLITYFMLTKVGKEWVMEATPDAIKDRIESRGRSSLYMDMLHETDFIHLADILFKPYAASTPEELIHLLQAENDLSLLTKDEIAAFIPKSNWDRYFSEIVECEAAFLEKRWKRLYELRIKVAHNLALGKSDFEELVDLVEGVESFIQKAIDRLDRVHVPEDDKDQIAENIVASISAKYGEFILVWKSIDSTITQLVKQSLPKDLRSSSRPISLRDRLGLLDLQNTLHEEELGQILKLSDVRNRVVHDANVELTEAELDNYTRMARAILERLDELSAPASWHELCVKRIEKAMEISLDARSKTTYQTQDEKVRVVCLVSKPHVRKNSIQYWFGYHRSQHEFIEGAEESFIAFGCGSPNELILMPSNELSQQLDHMHVTDSGSRYYWHVRILEKDGEFFLERRDQNPLNLAPYHLPM